MWRRRRRLLHHRRRRGDVRGKFGLLASIDGDERSHGGKAALLQNIRASLHRLRVPRPEVLDARVLAHTLHPRAALGMLCRKRWNRLALEP